MQTGSLGHCHRRLVDPLLFSGAQTQSQAGEIAHRLGLLLQDRHAVGPLQYPGTVQEEKLTGRPVHAPPSAVERAAEPHPLPSPNAKLTRIIRGTRGYMPMGTATLGPGTSARRVAPLGATSLRILIAGARFPIYARLWSSRSRPGSVERRVTAETISLIREMATKNRLWGAERIRGELLKVGIKISKRTVQKYMRAARERRGGGQTWATFVKNHANDIWCCDFVQTYDLLFRPLLLSFLLNQGSRPGGPYSGHAEPDPGVDGATVAERDHGELGANRLLFRLLHIPL